MSTRIPKFEKINIVVGNFAKTDVWIVNFQIETLTRHKYIYQQKFLRIYRSIDNLVIYIRVPLCR